jgi:membrane protease YdiL (CAAX protease family)
MLFRKDGYDFDLKTMAARFRLVRFARTDWLWLLGAVVTIMVLNGVIMAVWKLLSVRFCISPMDTSAPFLHFDPLRGSARLLLFIWIPFFFFNIVGEELLWRGYILPRQELNFGKFAWLVNAGLWLIFHICFGLDLIIILLPVLFIVPYVVQRRKNTWIGIAVHALVNGPSFILISLGLI